MKLKVITILILLCFIAVPVGFTAEKAGSAKVADVGNKICPIMGGDVDPKISYVYEGKRYHFCCKACLTEFKKSPEKYILKIKETEGLS
jgi:YHS domain-containing protein